MTKSELKSIIKECYFEIKNDNNSLEEIYRSDINSKYLEKGDTGLSKDYRNTNDEFKI